jgi:integrase
MRISIFSCNFDTTSNLSHEEPPNKTRADRDRYQLRLRDINLEEGFLRVQPDGAKNAHRIRIIPLNPIARAAIERVLELAGKRGSKAPDHYLFPYRVRGNGTWGIYDPTKRCNIPSRGTAALRWMSRSRAPTKRYPMSTNNAGCRI